MPGYPMKLVTIVCEELACNPLTRLLHAVNARGYTLTHVEGEGAKGMRGGEMAELANIKLEVLVPPPVAELLLERLEKEFFPHYAIIAYETEIRVMRSDKF